MKKVDPWGQTCATNTSKCPRGSRKLWALHNFGMWIAWVVCMVVIVFSSRYGKYYWRNSVFIHAVIGTLIGLVTAVGGMEAWIRLKGM